MAKQSSASEDVRLDCFATLAMTPAASDHDLRQDSIVDVRALPTTDHRPPTTDHRPPTTDNQQPATSRSMIRGNPFGLCLYHD